jgi:hypothetical protein
MYLQHEKRDWFCNIKNITERDIKNFGCYITTRKIIDSFILNSKKEYIGCKHQKTNSSCVKKWIKENKPNQYFCCFTSQTDYYKDDVVSIYYDFLKGV